MAGGLNLSLSLDGQLGGGTPGWILATGHWVDTQPWNDSKFWKDS